MLKMSLFSPAQPGRAETPFSIVRSRFAQRLNVPTGQELPEQLGAMACHTKLSFPQTARRIQMYAADVPIFPRHALHSRCWARFPR
jgi:hypothetical protein